jgi:RHS repeat-associated protein
MLCPAKEEISLWPVMGASVLSLAADPAFAETRIPEHTQLAENSRQGFESTNHPSHPEKIAAKSTTALGVSCFRRSGTAVGSGVVYDGDGNRVAETAAGVTTKYLIDALNPTGYSQVIDEVVSGAVTKTYTYGRQRISENQLSGSTWTPTFYGYDGHGNVRFTTNTAGTVGNTYQFDAFGMPVAISGSIANTYLYSGERFDSNLNLYQLRARFYNMLTGRFETMDPGKETCCALSASKAGNIFDPATLHKYVYTRNNPVNRIDPSGRADSEEYITLDVRAIRILLKGSQAYKDCLNLLISSTFASDEEVLALSMRDPLYFDEVVGALAARCFSGLFANLKLEWFSSAP